MKSILREVVEAGYISIRGGRMTKYKGTVASYAPSGLHPVQSAGLFLQSVSSMALGLGIAVGGVGSVQAGTCTLNATTGIYECSGAADADGNDPGLTLFSTNDITVTTQPGFGVDTSNINLRRAFSLLLTGDG